MPRYVFDLETDGLIEDLSKIHCLVLKDIDTGQMSQFHDSPDLDSDGTVEDGLTKLQDADLIVAHNYIGFDRKAILKLYPEWIEPKYHDTLILSQILYSNFVQAHSIAEWGRKFKQPKPKHEDWTQLSEDMLYRCREDTHILHKLFSRCEKGMKKYSIQKAITLEYRVYEIDSEYEYWYINESKLHHFIKRLTLIKELMTKKIIKIAPPQPQDLGTFTKIYKKDGNFTANVTKYCAKANIELDNLAGPFSKVDFIDINPNSNRQVQGWLCDLGWRPEFFNYKKGPDGKPLKDENNLPIVSTPKFEGEFYGIDPNLSALLKRFNKVSKRLSTLESYNKSQTNGRMPRSALTCGTNTARYRHRGIVNVPKASKSVFLGRLMRSLFNVPEGYSLVGCDASQLESRIEGHYTSAYDGGAYAKSLLEEDVHQATADALGVTRNEGKTINYALQYGASYKKIMTITGKTADEAKQMVDAYWDIRPAAKQLKDTLIDSVESRGYSRRESLWNTRAFVKTIDGRPIFVRSWHSLVNSLIQSTGMICMKIALCFMYKWLKDKKIPARLAIMYHDEYQWIVKEGYEAQVEELGMLAIKRAGEYFNLRVPLEAEAKSGKTWRDTH